MVHRAAQHGQQVEEARTQARRARARGPGRRARGARGPRTRSSSRPPRRALRPANARTDSRRRRAAGSPSRRRDTRRAPAPRPPERCADHWNGTGSKGRVPAKRGSRARSLRSRGSRAPRRARRAPARARGSPTRAPARSSRALRWAGVSGKSSGTSPMRATPGPRARRSLGAQRRQVADPVGRPPAGAVLPEPQVCGRRQCGDGSTTGADSRASVSAAPHASAEVAREESHVSRHIFVSEQSARVDRPGSRARTPDPGAGAR